MGKNKAQRTKGNVKPSSSGRTAQLLQHGAINNPFIGFGAFNDNINQEENSSEVNNEELDFSCDSELLLLLKKMQKKDSVTKIKALQEFSDFCQNKDESTIKAILPFWPKLFCKLASDNDWKVREASYKAMQQLVLRVQKEIAPYLKQLIPIWLISLFDSCPPAACAAMNSFNSVFPLKKQAEVFNFCKTEIFNYCKETLSKAAQTSTTKNSENDTDEKQIRATVGSLKVLNLVLAKVDSENSKEFIHSLLSEEQFWKLCKHQNEEVRASWYRFKSTICENFPEIIRQHSVVACRTTFNYISESDPLISVEIWANILSLIRVLDDWWKHINLHNSFLHQLKILMRKKAHIASTFFPSLLPILKHLPSDALKDYNKFTIELFESFMESLRNTENLPTDFKYVVVSYFQCAHYFAFDAEIANQDDKNKLFIFLIDNQVKNILMRFLKENKFKKRNNIFYTELMKFANRLEAVPEKQEKLGNCILEVCLTILRNAVNQIEFLSGLTSFMNDAKRLFNDKEIRNVQFFGAKETEPVIDVLQKKFPHFYESLLINILCESLKLKSEDTEWITFIFNLTEVFNCLLFLNEKDSSALKLFVQEFLMQTITKEPDIKKQKNIQIIIDLMFKIYDVSEEKSKSFNELLIIKDPLVREQVVKNIANRNQKDKFISNWTESEEAIEFIFNLAKDLVDRIHSRNESTKLEWNALWNSLILFFGLHNVNTKCLNKVIKLFEEVIRSNKASNEIVSFVCEVTENIFILYKPCETLLSMKDLLLLFFKLSCEKSHLKEKLVPVWAKGVELICGNTGAYASDNSLISLIANEIHQMLNGQIKDEEKALMVSDNIHTFLNIINNYSLSIEQENSFMSTLILDETLALILNQILLSDKEWGNLTLTLDKNFLLKLWYDGTLSVFPEIFKVAEINTDPHPVVFSSLVTARILNSLTFETTNCPNFTNFFPSILHTCTIYSYFKIFSSVLSYKRIVKIDQIFPTFHKQYELITKKYCGYLKDEMTIQLFNLSRKNGLLYGLALNDLLQILETSLSISSDSLTLDNVCHKTICILQLIMDKCKNLTSTNTYEEVLHYFLCAENIFDGAAYLSIIYTFLKLQLDFTFENHVYPILEYFRGLKDNQSDVLINDGSDKKQQILILLVNIFEIVIQKWISHLSDSHKDMIFCFLTSCTISLSNDSISTNSVSLVLACRLLKVILTISELVKSDSSANSQEWIEFHARKIYASLLPLFFGFDFEASKNIPAIYHFLCTSSDVLVNFSKNNTLQFSSILPEKQFAFEIETKISTLKCVFPSNEEALLNNLYPLMTSCVRPFYFTAHSLIISIICELAAKLTIGSNDEEDESYISPPPALLSTLCQTDQFMEAMLCDFRVGDCCCIVDPTTDAHHYSLAYLFTWCQIFEYFSFLTPENRSLLSGYLNESGTLFKLLNNVFRLMPIHEDADTDPRSMILTSFDFHAAEPPSSREIQHMSSQVYIMALRKMPASIRLWLSNQDKRVVDVVNQFTTNYASNFLSSEELKSIQASSLSSFKNLTVKARPTAREVTALYSVEDMSIELTIQFPLNYPLSPVTIDSGKRVGVTSSQWRTWLLQLTTFLTHQNGSIIDALLLWKKNIDKRFEGVEECMICFYILHGSTCQLPKLSCKHCKKKYHSACLYKWFKTSNNATCPLCRNLF